jgi:hypothetical protein
MEARRSGSGTSLLIGIAVAVGIVLTGWAEAPAGAGPVGSVLPMTCRSRSDCGSPVKGGIRITFTGWSCTTGFLARDAASRELYVLTAGHCLVGSGLSALWDHHNSPIGRAALEAFHHGSNADVGAIAVSAASATNQVYGSTNADIRHVTGWLPIAAQVLGTEVCRSGGASGWRCGSIVAADVDVTIEGALIHHAGWTDFPSAEGDSGAPLLDGQGRAIGIVIATTSTGSVYSTIEGIATELHVRLCVDPGCD